MLSSGCYLQRDFHQNDAVSRELGFPMPVPYNSHLLRSYRTYMSFVMPLGFALVRVSEICSGSHCEMVRLKMFEIWAAGIALYMLRRILVGIHGSLIT